MHVLTTRINNKNLSGFTSGETQDRNGRVLFEGKRRWETKARGWGEGPSEKIQFHGRFCNQSAGLLPVHAPMDEGIIPSHAYNCFVDRVSPSKLFSESDWLHREWNIIKGKARRIVEGSMERSWMRYKKKDLSKFKILVVDEKFGIDFKKLFEGNLRNNWWVQFVRV